MRNVYPNETRPKLNSKNKKLNAQAYPPTVTNKERELKTQSDLILVILVLAEHPRKHSLWITEFLIKENSEKNKIPQKTSQG